jgi:Spy/CpxP family protein refolding chaperone
MKALDYSPRVAAACGFAFALLILCAPTTHAQGAQQQQQGQQQAAQQPAPRAKDGVVAAELLSQLNLTPEQVTRMREIREQSVPQAREMTRRLNQARRALDEAIYSDSVDEALVEQRAREVSEAQAALVRLRAQTELRVRRVLTPEQLQIFRDLRLRARRQQRIQRRIERGTPPARPNR